MKTCTKCLKTKEITEFKLSKRYKGGYTTWCKICCQESNRITKQAQKWCEKHRERVNELKALYNLNNRDKVKATKKKWYQKNVKHQLALTRKYQASKRNACPSWLSQEQWEEIKMLYKICPKGYHIDHIIPLQGKNICGLHVPWNLQILPASENQKKSNKVA